MTDVTVEFVGYNRDGDKVFSCGDMMLSAMYLQQAERMFDSDLDYAFDRDIYILNWGPITKEKPDA